MSRCLANSLAANQSSGSTFRPPLTVHQHHHFLMGRLLGSASSRPALGPPRTRSPLDVKAPRGARRTTTKLRSPPAPPEWPRWTPKTGQGWTHWALTPSKACSSLAIAGTKDSSSIRATIVKRPGRRRSPGELLSAPFQPSFCDGPFPARSGFTKRSILARGREPIWRIP
jgi:hypothetical protein